MKSRTVSVFIRRAPKEVYDFAVEIANFPLWATSFCRSAKPDGDDWMLDTPLGAVRFRFVPRNAFGVLDHWVTLPSGEKALNPMRVVPNGEGSEVLFTLFQLSDVSDLQFVEDVAMVERDLRTLKEVLEG